MFLKQPHAVSPENPIPVIIAVTPPLIAQVRAPAADGRITLEHHERIGARTDAAAISTTAISSSGSA